MPTSYDSQERFALCYLHYKTKSVCSIFKIQNYVIIVNVLFQATHALLIPNTFYFISQFRIAVLTYTDHAQLAYSLKTFVIE